uniref:Uncharacterized protein n=1 Tax=Ditylenchus dipsaci TaxID=166011 RepID=A0A915EJS5_9BILA
MSWIFGNKPTDKEIERANERELRSVNRGLATDFRQLERKEKELELEIKKLAKAGHKDACVVLAKQLVQLRKQKAKSVTMSANISGMATKNKQMKSMGTMAKAMGTAAQTMKVVDQQMPLDKFAKDMRDFSQTQDKMDLREEIMGETLDSLLDVDEGEEDKVIDQVLDEIGIEMNEKLSKVPRIKENLGETSKTEQKMWIWNVYWLNLKIK